MERYSSALLFVAILFLLGATTWIGESVPHFWTDTARVTEPAMVLFGSGLICLAMYGRKKLRK